MSKINLQAETTNSEEHYVVGVVAGSKDCTAGYSAAVWAYYRHIEGVVREGGGRLGGKRGKREGKKGGESKCKEAKVKKGGMVATKGDGKGAVIVE